MIFRRSMKILTYNINGIRQFNNKGLLKKLLDDFEDVDIFCFQEVKANNVEVSNIMSEYTNFLWYYDENTFMKNYAGVLTLWKNKINCSGNTGLQTNIELSEDEYKYWTGRKIFLNTPECYLINLYIPNSGNKEKLRMLFDKTLLETIKTYNTDKPIIIVGDMNVCSTELDYWGNYNKSIDTCPGLMKFEIEAFKTLLDSGYIDVFREKNPNIRKYSYFPVRAKNSVENNKGWRLDYVLINENDFSKIKNIEIYSGYNGPDHSPIIVEI